MSALIRLFTLLTLRRIWRSMAAPTKGKPSEGSADVTRLLTQVSPAGGPVAADPSNDVFAITVDFPEPSVYRLLHHGAMAPDCARIILPETRMVDP